MILHGRVENGVVRLLGGPVPEEGTEGTILVGTALVHMTDPKTGHPVLPTVVGGLPGTWNLTNERIGEILDEEDSLP